MIRIEKLQLKYAKKQILHNADLQVEKGQLVSLIGKSGSGKSSLLYILGGFLKPDSGIYQFDEKPVYRLGEFGLGAFRKKNIGFVFQDFRLLPFLTVQQNIRLPLYFSGKKTSRSFLSSLVQKLGLEHRKKAYPLNISGGEAQRTAIGRSLVNQPRVLLLDEPTGNLDLETEKEIIELLLDFKKSGLTLVCATHSPGIVAISDVVYEVAGGTVTKKEPVSLPAKKKQVKKKAKKVSK